jgi:hypothetical protein
MRTLATAREVVDTLGGNRAVCDLTGALPKAVYYWTGHARSFPSRTYCLMSDELRARGAKAPRDLWKMLPKKPPKGKSNGKQRRNRAARS